jgi:hypothetical protein
VVGATALKITFHEFSQYPKCSNEIVYVAKLLGTQTLPDFITFTPKTKTFSISSMDVTLVDTYHL